MKKIIVIGGGGHAKVVIDIIKNNGYKASEIEILDDNLDIGSEILSCKVSGKVKDALKYDKGTKFVIAIGNNEVREKISNMYKLDYTTFIHPSAVIGEDVNIGKGSVIMGGSVINSGTEIGKHSIINTSSTIDHDSNIGDFVHLSPGVHMGGTVNVGNRTWLGVGTSVKNNISIGSDTIIGAGSVVVKNVEEKGTYVGNPLRKIK